MTITKLQLVVSALIIFAISCKENSSHHKLVTSEEAKVLNPNSETKVVSGRGEIEFSKAVLYTIDASIYHARDTIWDFPDGKRAYEFVFGGAAFVDSAGNPIHNRFKKFRLSDNQITRLKSDFIGKLCDRTTTACLKVYRDVIVLQDSSENNVGQIQICFGCADVEVYPSSKFNCVDESDLNLTEFKTYVNSIKVN
jgi:hypothetical protein